MGPTYQRELMWFRLQCVQRAVSSAQSASAVLVKMIKHEADCSKSQCITERVVSDFELQERWFCCSLPLVHLRWVTFLVAEGSPSLELVFFTVIPWALYPPPPRYQGN